jgi:hypothetical protein
MKIILKLIIVSFFLTPFLLEGQNYFLIKRKNDSKHTKILYFDHLYTIKTIDTTYFSEIINASDSTLTITIDVKRADSMMVISQKSKGAKYDTSYTHWQVDTIQVYHRDIQHLEKDLLRNRRWLDPIFWTMVGGGIGVLVAQSTIHSGNKSRLDGIGFAGGFVGITVPLIFICTRKTKFDMINKWSFAHKQATKR